MVFKSKFPDVKPDECYKDLVSNFFWSQLDKYRENVLFLDYETGRRWTGGEIKSTSVKLARGLIRHKLVPGDNCVIFFKHCDYIQLTSLGVLFAGGSICTGCDADPELEHHYMLSVMRPKFVFVKHELVEETLRCRKSICPFTIIIMDDDSLDENQFDRLVAAAHKTGAPLLGLHHHLLAPSSLDGANLPVQVDPQQPAFVLLTSGSTGRPKPVCRSQMNSLYVCHSLVNASELWDLSEASVVAAHLPLDHGTGIFHLKQCLAQGYKSIIINGYQLDTMLKAIRVHRITDLVLGSALVHNLVSSQEVARLLIESKDGDCKPLESLRNLLAVGSTIASLAAVRNFMQKLPQCSVRQAFGTSETGFLFVVPRELALREPELEQRCVGLAMPNVEVKLIGRCQSSAWDQQQAGESSVSEEITEFDQLGELYVRGPTVSPGYVGEQFAEQARASFLPDGFYKTNDLCSLSPNGMLRAFGRFSEILCLSDGWKVLPYEIEQIILECPQVREAAVVGVPHPNLPTCHAPRAYIVPRDGVKVVDCEHEDDDENLKLTLLATVNGNRNGQMQNNNYIERTHSNGANELVEGTRKETVSRQRIFDFVAERLSEPKHLIGGIKFVSELPKISIGKVDKRALKKADGIQ